MTDVIGLPELALILLVVGPGALFFAIMGPRWYRRVWVHFVERRHTATAEVTLQPLRLACRVSFIATATFLLLVGLCALGDWSSVIGVIGLAGLAVFFVACFGGMIACFWKGLLAHLRITIPRHTKYEWLTTGGVLFVACTWQGLGMIAWISEAPRRWSVLGVGLLALPLAVWLPECWFRRLHRKYGLQTPPGAMRIYRLLSYIPPVFFVLAAWTMVLLPVCVAAMVARYWSVEWTAVRPFLYLRSFSYADGPLAFASIIAKACKRYGLVRTLLHDIQSGEALVPRLAAGTAVIFTRVPDAEWQGWVEHKLRMSRAVILDDSLGSPSLDWELSKAMLLLGPARVLVLRKAGSVHSGAPVTIARIEYGLDPILFT